MKPTAISANEARVMLDDGLVTFVDARNPQAWAASSQKLPGALRIPSDEVEQHLAEIPLEGTVVAYCT